jgi:hypothetical protein
MALFESKTGVTEPLLCTSDVSEIEPPVLQSRNNPKRAQYEYLLVKFENGEINGTFISKIKYSVLMHFLNVIK